MKNTLSDIIKSFKKQPLWTAYSLILAPLFYLFLFMTALTLGVINLSTEDAINFWEENK